MSRKLRVTQVRSTIGKVEPQKRVMVALGFRKMGQTVIHDDKPSIRGMIEKVRHLVKVEEFDGE